jgi:nucleoside-diphosphate-sugar epimerase
VVAQLVARGHTVWGTSQSGRPPADPAYRDAIDRVQWLSWRSEETPLPAHSLAEVDGVIHLAAGRDRKGFPDAEGALARTTVVASLAFLDHAREAGLPLVLAGSGDCVAAGPPIASETDRTVAPTSYYGACKGAMELLARPHWEAGLPVAVVRPFHPYGPGGDAFLVNRLLRRVSEGQAVTIEGSEGILVNPVWVDDAARGFAAALERRAAGLFQLGGPEMITLRDLLDRMASLLGRAARVRTVDRAPPGGHAGHWSLAKEQLDWRPTVDLNEGLARVAKLLRL